MAICAGTDRHIFGRDNDDIANPIAWKIETRDRGFFVDNLKNLGKRRDLGNDLQDFGLAEVVTTLRQLTKLSTDSSCSSVSNALCLLMKFLMFSPVEKESNTILTLMNRRRRQHKRASRCLMREQLDF